MRRNHSRQQLISETFASEIDIPLTAELWIHDFGRLKDPRPESERS